MNRIVVVVEEGRVTDVFSRESCDIEVIDLDEADDYDKLEDLRDGVQSIRDSKEYFNIF